MPQLTVLAYINFHFILGLFYYTFYYILQIDLIIRQNDYAMFQLSKSLFFWNLFAFFFKQKEALKLFILSSRVFKKKVD